MGRSSNSRIADATSALPPELQSPVERWFERLDGQHGLSDLPAERADALVRLVACSEFGASVVLKNWAWFIDNVDSFGAATNADRELLESAVLAAHDADELQSRFRQIRHRTLLRILWRELFGLADLDETLEQLSRLADSMLDAATRSAERLLEARYGYVRDAAGKKVPLVVLGMGKLGGFELNFSSDIDLIFLFTRNGETDGTRSLSAQEYFARLSRQIIALIDEPTVDGFVFRIDTRLRPFGDSGPPVVSFAALESYLLQHGRDWERYAYVKARIVGTQPGTDVQNDLYDDLIRPFEDNDRVLQMVTQWPLTLPAFEAVHGTRAKPATSFEMGLSPISIGADMITDAAPHFISMLMALVGPGHFAGVTVESEPGARPEHLTLSGDYGHEGGTCRATLSLITCPEPPRPAWYAINGVRADREIELPGYQQYLAADGKRAALPDPLMEVAARFVTAVAAGHTDGDSLRTAHQNLLELAAALPPDLA